MMRAPMTLSTIFLLNIILFRQTLNTAHHHGNGTGNGTHHHHENPEMEMWSFTFDPSTVSKNRLHVMNAYMLYDKTLPFFGGFHFSLTTRCNCMGFFSQED